MSAEASSVDGVAGQVLLDVRPLIENGEEPFPTVMETVADLGGRSLLLIAPFEPTPLQGVLSAQGFSYASERISDDEWRILFQPPPDESGAPVDVDAATGTEGRAPSAEERSAADGPETAASSTDAENDTDPGPAGDVAAPDAGSDTASTTKASPYTIRGPRAAGGGTTTTTGAPASIPTPAAVSTPKITPPISPAAIGMNPTLNVPPAWLPLGFMAAAGLGLIGFGLALVVTAPTVVVAPRNPHVLATVHFAVLAFLSTAVLGALHQFGPVVGGKPLRSIPIGVTTGVLFVPGVWLIPLGFATGHDGIVQIGGVMATTAVCLAAWNVSRALSATGKGAPIVGLRLAVTYLVVTAAFGVTYAFDRSHSWFGLLDHRVLAHAHIGLLGWLGLAYVAVAEKLWPMFLLAHRPHAHEGERAVWFLGIGAPLVLIGLLFSWEPVTIIGGAYVVPGLFFHLASLTSVIRHRRRNLELLHGFVIGSAVCLVLAVGLGLTAGLAPLDYMARQRLVSAEVLALILWLTLAVIGHAHKIVPFISWNRLRDRGITKGRDGRPLLFAHLVNALAARVTFVVVLVAAVAGLGGVLSDTAVLMRIGGVMLAIGGLVAVANLVSGPLLMIRWHNRNAADDGGAS